MKRKSGDLLRRRVMSSRMGIVSTHLAVFVNAGYKELTTVTVCKCGIQRSCGEGIFRHGNEPHGGASVARSEERRVGKEWRSLCDWSSDVCLPIYKELTTVTVCKCGIQRSCGEGIFRHGNEPHGGASVATDNHTEYYHISTVSVQLNLEVIEGEGDSKGAPQATVR